MPAKNEVNIERIPDCCAHKTKERSLKEYKNLGTVKTVGETLLENEAKISAFREYYVDQDDLERKVIELFYEEKPTGSEG